MNEGLTGVEQHEDKFVKIIQKSVIIKDGNPARYRLQKKTENLDQSEPYRKITFGNRDRQKPHKTILMVGETGTGKTTLINVMINYMLGVQREDKVWFEITDDQSDRTSAHNQTSRITVYGFYLQESPTDLTIIDTPGYGDTYGISLDKEIATSLLSLSESAEGIKETHAVCLVMMAHQNRLSDRQRYIFDAVQSLFGRDIAENIVLLFTHSTGTQPKNALTAVKEAKIKCAENDKNQPVFFLFNNCQSDAADEEYEKIWDQLWKHSFKGMAQFSKFLNNMKPKTLQMTRDVLQKWKQLDANIFNLQSCVQKSKLKQNELKRAQDVLEQNKEYVKNDTNFEYEAEITYNEKVDIDPVANVPRWWCTICEEYCHYQDSGVAKTIWNSVMRINHCTMCKNKCEYNKHNKERKKCVGEKRTNEDLKKDYVDKIRHDESEIEKLKEELMKFDKEKLKLVLGAFHCVEILQMFALNTDSMITLQQIDFLIEMLKEENENEKVETLEKLKKKRAGEEKLENEHWKT